MYKSKFEIYYPVMGICVNLKLDLSAYPINIIW